MPSAPSVTVLYDLDCGFCRWSVASLLRWDRARRLRPVAIQSGEGQQLLAGVAPELRLKTAHAITPDGRVHSGGDAVAVVASVLPLGAPVSLVARAVPGPMRLAYGVVAGNRTRLSKLVSADRKARADALLDARRSG